MDIIVLHDSSMHICLVNNDSMLQTDANQKGTHCTPSHWWHQNCYPSSLLEKNYREIPSSHAPSRHVSRQDKSQKKKLFILINFQKISFIVQNILIKSRMRKASFTLSAFANMPSFPQTSFHLKLFELFFFNKLISH